jgi:hypothetical protein
MRARAKRLVPAVCLALAAACGHSWSIHPLFGEKELAFEPALVGVWSDIASPRNDRWVVIRESDTARALVLVLADSAAAGAFSSADLESFAADDSTTRARLERDPVARARRERDSAVVVGLRSDARGPRWFDVRLGRLAGVLFADLTPQTFTDSEPRLGRPMQIPAHWFWKISVEGDRLHVVPLSDEWLRKQIDSNAVRIAHEKEDGNIVLTAPTRELQRLVSRYATDTLAFPAKAEIVLQRQR